MAITFSPSSVRASAANPEAPLHLSSDLTLLLYALLCPFMATRMDITTSVGWLTNYHWLDCGQVSISFFSNLLLSYGQSLEIGFRFCGPNINFSPSKLRLPSRLLSSKCKLDSEGDEQVATAAHALFFLLDIQGLMTLFSSAQSLRIAIWSFITVAPLPRRMIYHHQWSRSSTRLDNALNTT